MRSYTTPVRPGIFFGLTFLLSWVIWVPLALSHLGGGPLRIPEGLSALVRMLGVLAPAVAALWLTARAGGRPALRELLGRLTLWRVGWRWWVAALFVVPGALTASGLLYNALGADSPVVAARLSGAVLAANVIILGLATLGEEIGWRGVALPALQGRQTPGAASVVLGLLWGLWHLPFWLLLDTYDTYGIGYLALNLLLALPMTVYITWFTNRGRGSLLLPVGFHLAFNLVNVVWLPVTASIGAFAIFVGVLWVLALSVWGRLSPAVAAPMAPEAARP